MSQIYITKQQDKQHSFEKAKPNKYTKQTSKVALK